MIWLDKISSAIDLSCLDVSGLIDRERFVVTLFYILHNHKLDLSMFVSKQEKVYIKLIQNDIGNIMSTLEMGFDWVELFYMTMNNSPSLKYFREVYYSRHAENQTPAIASGVKRTRASYDHDEMMIVFGEIVDKFDCHYNLGSFLLEIFDGTAWNSAHADVRKFIERSDRSLSQGVLQDVVAHFMAIKNYLLEYRSKNV